MLAETFKQSLTKKRTEKQSILDDTDSDSDFESLSLVAKTGHGKRVVSGYNSTGRRHRVKQSNYLEEHLTIGELAGRVPSSLLVNIDF